ncbi:MAG: SIMPL domain-containing protein [Patescibacteria group bacterium]
MSETNDRAGFPATSWKSPRAIMTIIGMLLLAGIITVAILRDRIVNEQFRSVTVTGQGKITYNPDIAVVTLGVQIDKVAKPDEALNQLNAKVASIIAAIKAQGIGVENIDTQNYSLYPQYDYKDNISVVSGYNANEQLVVKVLGYDQNPGKLSAVIAAASKAGANQVNNLAFDATNMNDLKQQARLAAITDAKSKSTALATAAGIHLEDITGWYENLVSPQPYYAGADYGKGGMGGAAVSSPSTPAGNREVIIEIGVTYNIK